ncbi:G-protein coupled receptor GRL101-like isoform X3 [Ruditapes philippinarum]|uniref:G-protein coupled receptor GRL101-like isoform X3 n=1 Tax=Ruditapes philippinarum TaxID=129788 RepID=UPI00295B6FFD|nr:G-protein coupled receptor GRL101-like isoform X3 [Ruditapes philippinarum]
MSFEIFNTEKLWSTVDCFDDLVDFFICEKPFIEDGFQTKTGIMENECTSIYRKEDFIASPYSDTSNIILPEKGLSVMKCSDGLSILKINWCDRNFDCIDYKDELFCQNDIIDHSLTNTGTTMINTHLPDRLKHEAFFRCEKSKEWISTLAKCDDVIDCLDASDEVTCFQSKSACGKYQFSCDGGHCLNQYQVCDFIIDCKDGTDESCDFRMCDINEFRCTNGQCIPVDNRCNAVYDCFDNSDEINCDSCQNSFHCVDDYKCIPYRLTCDIYPDCSDKSDEQNCVVIIPTTDVFNIEYLPGKLSDQSCTWDFDQKGKESGRITYSRQCLFQLDSAYFFDGFNERYSCFVKVRNDCKFRFREAALIDNNNSDFAFPSCHCTIGTFRKGKPFKKNDYNYHELDIDSVTGCDGSEIAELLVPDESYVYNNIQSTSDLATFIWPKVFSDTDITVGLPYCTYDYNASVFGDWFKCERDNKIIPESMVCIYSVGANGYMTGCRSGDHLQNCEKFLCPENTVKCPGSYCIEQGFLCDGHIECPGGEDEQDCTCQDSDREVILFVEDGDPESGETAVHLAKQFFTNVKDSLVRLFFFRSLNISVDFDITFRLLEIREERVNQLQKNECKYTTMARDFLKRLRFTKSEKRGIIVLENSNESAVVSSLALSNLSQPEFLVYRVIKDFSSSLYEDDKYKFVKDIHISKWKSLYWTGFRRFPEICTEAAYVPCAGKFRCSSSKQCIPFEHVCDNVVHCKNGDDERLCNSVCPQKCKCVGDVINCRAANIYMSDLSSLTKYVRSLDLSKNPTIKDIHENHLNFHYMLRLNISSCDIHHIDNKTFFYLKKLVVLDLSNNRIQQLPVVFSELRYLNISSCDIRHIDKKNFVNLQYLFSLDLSGNKIQLLPDMVFGMLRYLTHLNLDRNFELTEISPTAFTGLIALRNIKITGTKLKKISSFTFSDLHLDSIDISYNKIEEIENDAFKNSKVSKINFEGNNVLKFEKLMFNGVTSLQKLHTPAFKFCCIRPCYVSEEECTPLRNEFSSCEDLIRNSVLQAVLWIVGIASLCGNLSSIIYRLVFDRERLKIGYGIFVTNLAVADFLMGVYLIMIAVADSYYRNRYTSVDDYWRNSNWCVTAGILSTVSSEASVFFLCFITLDRLLVIKFPFGTVRFRPTKAYICCGICWFISITLSIIPILYTSHFKNQFYSKTGVCIALPLTRDKPPGWMYSVSIFVGLNFCTFILVAVGQLAIFKELRRASVMKKTQQSRKRDLKVARNLILVATTDFLCWFPIGVMGILSLIGFAIPSDVYAWTAIFVLPINSALNPFLYTLSAILGKKSFNPSIDEQSRTMVQKEIGSAILRYQKFSRSVRMKQEVVPVGTMRCIQGILNDDRCLSVSIVAAVSKQLAEYLSLLQESFIVIDEICETNVYITKAKYPIVVIDAKSTIAADERAIQENMFQYGKLLRKLVSKCDKNLKM